ncbi:transcriptional regulator, TetR family [Caldicellulosiruptor saccharolyticus DSM 8903]|uniref:Transcriptional regulator, TetR family n=1 Tax=Caldicellulosiruptor saccharolyticus (strain ATCC 43494 / DSM 8903 / Tp8T 6331) TaxID=351627 RepID=A4XLI8_CALS8|nr:TetR/AcrR family transcriptional regulator [Caldicellulosiruptor saccharolyticus]ABP67773.2 transcriptional regulator, TetR family [Caldicellulosiruptor saccharolyticus DSM 8903]
MRKSEDTKNRIIQSAIKLISQNGYAATTTAQIAKDAGISEATLFKYFKDKENLLHKVVSVALTQILDSVALSPLKENIKKNKDLKASEFLRSIINERLEMLDRNIDLFKIILIEINYNDSLKNEVIKNMVPKTCEAKGLIEWILIRKGNISKEMAKGISRMMIGTLLTFLFQKYILGIETTSDEIEEEIENVLNVIKKSIGEE